MTKQKNSASSFELQAHLGKSYKVLQALGYDHIPDGFNPVWQALSGLAPWTEEELNELVEIGELEIEEANRLQEIADQGAELADRLKPLVWSTGGKAKKRIILHAYAVCQTSALNSLGGAIGTGEQASLRQRWYASKSTSAMGFKFASQALERYLVQSADVVLVDDDRSRAKAVKQGAKRVEFKVIWSKADEKELTVQLERKARVHIWPKSGWGRAYSQLHSAILADLVRDGLTYEQLWMEDISRQTHKASPLYPGFKTIFAIEKASLQPFFEPFCDRAGIPLLVMMAGNCSFSSVEALLNRNFRDYNGRYTPTKDDPLHLFVLSDFDYAGHVPVQQGVLEQFKRYLGENIVLHRVGVEPYQIKEAGRTMFEAGYIFEADTNSAYAQWAEEFGYWIGQDCYGIEVEVLTPAAYIPYLINAIVEAAGGDEELKKRLSEMAEPDWYAVERTIDDQAYNWSELWKQLEALYSWAEEQRESVENPIDNQVSETIGQNWDEDAWRNRDDVKEKVVEVVSKASEDITADAFVEHVSGENWNAWRPAGSQQANQAVKELFFDEFEDGLKDFVEDEDSEHEEFIERLKDVFVILEEDGLEL